MRYNLSYVQAESMISVPVSIPAAAGAAVSVWSLISTALAAIGLVDPLRVLGFRFKGTKVDASSYGAFVFGGEDTTGNGGSTGGNSYVAAGADQDLPVADPRKVFVVAPAAGAAVARVVEVFFVNA